MTAGADAGLLRRAYDTIAGYFELGNEVISGDDGRFIRNRTCPNRYDSNHVRAITASTPDEIGALLARADREYDGFAYRRFDVSPFTPPEFVARLALDGYETAATVQFLLEGDLRASPQACDIRAIETEEQWAQFDVLQEAVSRESAERAGRPLLDAATLRDFTISKRVKTPPLRYWMAYVEGEPRAYFSSWEGIGGIGMVEDLFTHPDYRHRGIATALIAHCVEDARSRGAGPIIIAADPNDTPKNIYASMGWRPIMLTSDYMRKLDA